MPNALQINTLLGVILFKNENFVIPCKTGLFERDLFFQFYFAG